MRFKYCLFSIDFQLCGSALVELSRNLSERSAWIQLLESREEMSQDASSLVELVGCEPCITRCSSLSSCSATASFIETACPPCVVPVAAAVTVGGGLTLSVGLTVTLIALAAAGIIGGGSIAGIGAGLSGGLMGVLLGKSGIFNSHKDRRRKMDSELPCESYDPLDTNDHDCFVLRWNKINWYFPFHKNLNRMERLVVSGENELENLAYNVLRKLDDLRRKIFGVSGTFVKPARDYGMIHDVALLGKVVDHLQERTAKIGERFEAVEDGADSMASSDASKIGSYFMEALREFRTDVLNVLGSQAASKNKNQASMNWEATKALVRALDDILAVQKESGFQLGYANKKERVAVASAIRAYKDQVESLNVIDNQAEKVDRQIRDRTQLLRDAIDLDLAGSVSRIDDRSTRSNRDARSQLEDTVFTLGESTKKQISDQRNLWLNLTHASMNRAHGIAADAFDHVSSQLLDLENRVLNLKVQNVSETIHAADLELLKKAKAQDAALTTVSRFIAWLMQDSEPQDVRSMEARFESDIQTELDSIQTAVDGLVGSNKSISKEGIAAIVAAIAAASKDSKSVLKMGESAYVSKVSEIMKLLGVNSFDAAGLFKKITKVVQPTQARGEPVLSRSLSGLFSSVDAMGGEMNRVTDTYNKQVVDILSDISTRAIRGDHMLSEWLSRDNKVRFSDGSYEVLNGAGRAESTANTLINSMLGIGTSSDLLAVMLSLYSMSSGSSFASLASALAQSDEDLLTDLQSDLNKTGNVRIPSLTLPSSLSDVRYTLNRPVDPLDFQSEKESLGSVAGLLNALQAETAGTNQSLFSLNAKARSNMIEALKSIDLESADAVSKYRAQFGSAMYDGTLESVGHFAQALLTQRRLDSERKGKELESDSRNIQSVSTSLAKVISALVQGVRNLEENSGIEWSSRFDSVEALNRAVGNLFSLTSGNLTDLYRRLAMMKNTVQEGILNFTSAVQSEIESLPAMIVNGSEEAVRDIVQSEASLDEKLRAAREAEAVAKSHMARIDAERALEVLTKLKAIQSGLAEADQQVRQEIGNISSSPNFRGIDMIQKVIAETANRIGVDDVNRVAESVNRISSVINPMIAEVVSEFQAEASMNTVKSVVDWSHASLDSKLKLTRFATTFAGNVTAKYENKTSREMQQYERLVNEVSSTEPLGVSESIGSVLRDVRLGRTELKSTVNSSVADIAAQQASVRMSLSAFLKLWREFLVVTQKKARIMVRNDQESLNKTTMDAMEVVRDGLVRVSRMNENIENLKSVTEIVGKEAAESESVWTSEIGAVLSEYDEKFNQRTNGSSSTELFAQVVNTSKLSVQETERAIENLLDGES